MNLCCNHFVEHQVMRIQTEQAPVPSQPEVVLSDGKSAFSILPKQKSKFVALVLFNLNLIKKVSCLEILFIFKIFIIGELN